MNKSFWLLDVNYEVKDHQPELWVWGIDNNGKRILIIDRNFFPYFYLAIKENEKPQVVVERIQSRKTDFPLLTRLEPIERKFFGKLVNAIKVCARINVAPEVNHRFRKEPPGFYKKVLSRLIAVRDEIRPKLKRFNPRSIEYRVLNARQKAGKVITNHRMVILDGLEPVSTSNPSLKPQQLGVETPF